MSVLSGKKIVLGISGGIAAYKTAHLVRLFIKAGADVKIVMSPAAKDFVAPLTLATLSKNPVVTSFTKEENHLTDWNNHVELGLWADLVLIAPATANTLSKMANGTCDNLLMAVYMSAKCPSFVAPAMDLDMYKNGATTHNLQVLEQLGVGIIPAEAGELASGLVGEGRMAEPENIVAFLEKKLLQQLPLLGKKVLITAGPTYEPIDPVRFIGNHSSGKMGYEIAIAAAQKGATVYLVSGPTALPKPDFGIHTIAVFSANEMFLACKKWHTEMDIIIAAAAVADYTPVEVASQKIKKSEAHFSLQLQKTQDILHYLGHHKTENQYVVGFALETENEIENAWLKVQKKNVDLIVLNSLNDAEAGFGKDTNKVTFIDRNKNIEVGEAKSKQEVAHDILQKILDHDA